MTPQHGQRGTHRIFDGETFRSGRDIYCACCNTWNTVEGTKAVFALLGKCKTCGAAFGERVNLTTEEALAAITRFNIWQAAQK